MRNLCISIVSGLIVASAAAMAQAAPLNLLLEPTPDIMSGFIDVSYTAASDQFSASGFALSFNDDGVGPANNINNGAFNLLATVDAAGNATGGSLIINGDVLGFGPPLLTGTLSNFGWLDGTNELFEFVFTVSGGDLAIPAYYGNPGDSFGVILTTVGSTFTGSWNSDFNNNGGLPGLGEGVSDTKPLVPEPATLAMIVLGGMVILPRRSRG